MVAELKRDCPAHTRRARKLHRGVDRGQSLLQMALVTPLLLVLVFGLVEFAQAWRTHQLITNTAREGARLAVLGTSNQAAVSSLITEVLTEAGLDPSNATVTYNGGSGTCDNAVLCRGVPEQVHIEYPYDFVYFDGVINLTCAAAGCDGSAYSSVTISTTAIMRGQ